ncbi:hypothetical protein ACFSHQ_00750 [Gemmobacter lanyuensis]
MTMGGAAVTLDPARDVLVNVNALGAPVPSARFMGGREWELTVPSPCPALPRRTARRFWRAALCCCLRWSGTAAPSPVVRRAGRRMAPQRNGWSPCPGIWH